MKTTHRADRPSLIRRGTAAVVIGLALAVTAVGGAAQAGTDRQSTGTYPDRTGDSGTAPDISGVTVASGPDGQILFRISIVNLPSPADVRTVLVLDTDMNEATGSPNSIGADFLFIVDESDQTYGFARWNGSDWDWETPYSTVSVNVGSTGVTISVNRSELGNTEKFNFWARTIEGEFADGRHDDAPDDGTWNYSLASRGPDIQAVLVATNPGFGPKAGKPFTVSVAGLRVPSTGVAPLLPQPDSYVCRATLAGKALAGRGTGGCTWTIPKTAERKQLRVILTVSYQGATKRVPFVYRVS